MRKSMITKISKNCMFLGYETMLSGTMDMVGKVEGF